MSALSRWLPVLHGPPAESESRREELCRPWMTDGPAVDKKIRSRPSPDRVVLRARKSASNRRIDSSQTHGYQTCAWIPTSGLRHAGG